MKSVHEPEKRLEACLKTIDRLDKEKDKELILKFHDKCFAEGLTNTRALYYLLKLKKISEWTDKDLDVLDRADIENLLSKINKDYESEWTKHGYRVTLKKFYKTMFGNGEEYPENVKWVKANVRSDKNGIPEILTKEEVKKAISTASKVRDKAMLSFLYESGCRVGELLNTKIGDIEFDDYGAKVKVVGKTGERKIRLVGCIPHLSLWLEHHPDKRKGSYLWVSVGQRNSKNRLSYRMVCQLVEDCVRKAGIEKKIHPHSFRHSRATHMAGAGINNAVLCEFFGWRQNSEMPSIYFHLSGEDVDRVILQMHGLKKEQKKDNFETNICQRCGEKNSPEIDYCLRCHAPLSEIALIKAEERKKLDIADYVKTVFIQQFKTDPEFRKRIVEERVKELQIKN